MKAEIISVSIGLLGLMVIIFLNYQTHLRYEELGELENIITLYNIGPRTRLILLVTQTIGLGFGSIPLKRKRKTGFYGILFCTLSIICLFIPLWPYMD